MLKIILFLVFFIFLFAIYMIRLSHYKKFLPELKLFRLIKYDIKKTYCSTIPTWLFPIVIDALNQTHYCAVIKADGEDMLYTNKQIEVKSTYFMNLPYEEISLPFSEKLYAYSFKIIQELQEVDQIKMYKGTSKQFYKMLGEPAEELARRYS